MKKTMYKIGIAALGLVITTAVVAGVTFAFQGEDGMGFGKGHMKMMGTVDVDYETWKQQLSDKGINEDLLTEENYNRMKEVHQLMEDGKYEEAKAIKEELGELGFGKGMKRGPKMDSEQREAVISALDSGDYNAWVTAMDNEEITSEVTEDEFPKLIEAHNLMQEGKDKMDQARELKEEIGLKGPGEKGMHRGMK